MSDATAMHVEVGRLYRHRDGQVLRALGPDLGEWWTFSALDGRGPSWCAHPEALEPLCSTCFAPMGWEARVCACGWRVGEAAEPAPDRVEATILAARYDSGRDEMVLTLHWPPCGNYLRDVVRITRINPKSDDARILFPDGASLGALDSLKGAVAVFDFGPPRQPGEPARLVEVRRTAQVAPPGQAFPAPRRTAAEMLRAGVHHYLVNNGGGRLRPMRMADPPTRTEYDFAGGVRGKYAGSHATALRDWMASHTIKVGLDDEDRVRIEGRDFGKGPDYAIIQAVSAPAGPLPHRLRCQCSANVDLDLSVPGPIYCDGCGVQVALVEERETPRSHAEAVKAHGERMAREAERIVRESAANLGSAFERMVCGMDNARRAFAEMAPRPFEPIRCPNPVCGTTVQAWHTRNSGAMVCPACKRTVGWR